MPDQSTKLKMSQVLGGVRLEMTGPGGEKLETDLVGDAGRQTLIEMYSYFEDPSQAGYPLADQTPAVFLLDPQLELSGEADGERMDFIFKGRYLPPFRFTLTKNILATALMKIMSAMEKPPRAN